jgi:hypothetical protein
MSVFAKRIHDSIFVIVEPFCCALSFVFAQREMVGTVHGACFLNHFLYLRQKQSIGRTDAISNNVH